VFTCFYFSVLSHFRSLVGVIVIAFLSSKHYFITRFYSYFYSYGLLLKLNDDDGVHSGAEIQWIGESCALQLITEVQRQQQWTWSWNDSTHFQHA